jgi:hypothetical protein
MYFLLRAVFGYDKIKLGGRDELFIYQGEVFYVLSRFKDKRTGRELQANFEKRLKNIRLEE